MAEDKNNISKEIYSLMSTARSNFKKNKYEKAIEVLDKIINLNSSEADAWNLKGDCFRKIDDYKRALSCYSRAVELDPKNTEYLNNKASLLANNDHIDEALIIYDQVLNIDSNNVRAWHNKGSSLSCSGLYLWGEYCCRKSLELDPLCANAWYCLGLCLLDQKKHDDVLQYFDKAISLNNKDEDYYLLKAHTLLEQDRTDEAIKTYSNMLKINKRHLYHLSDKAFSLKENKQYDKAIACFTEYIVHSSKESMIWVWLGQCYRHTELLPKAIDCMNTALVIDKNNDFAFYEKGRYLEENNNLPEAMECYNKAIEINPEDERYWVAKIGCLYISKDDDSALMVANEFLRKNPNKIFTKVIRIEILSKLKKEKEAEKEMESLFDIDLYEDFDYFLILNACESFRSINPLETFSDIVFNEAINKIVNSENIKDFCRYYSKLNKKSKDTHHGLLLDIYSENEDLKKKWSDFQKNKSVVIEKTTRIEFKIAPDKIDDSDEEKDS
jgi:tetratricopeptide (TPR) repeat protein